MTPLCPTCGQRRLSTYSMERIRSDMQPGLRRVYLAIVALWRELGAFPTTEMVADRVGLRSRRTVFVHLHRLIEKGYVTHTLALPPSHRFRLRVLPEGEPMLTKKTAAKKPAKKKPAKEGTKPSGRDDLLRVLTQERPADAPLSLAERDFLKSLLERVLGQSLDPSRILLKNQPDRSVVSSRQPTPPLTHAELQRECREFVSQALTGIVGDAASQAWIGGDDEDEPCCEMVELSEDLERFVTLRLGVPCVD